MSEYDFQQLVIERLSNIATRVEAIEQHLAKLNGKVVAQEAAIHQRQIDLLQHVTTCPIHGRMSEVEAALAVSKGAAAQNKTWIERLAPAAWAIAGALGAVILVHARDLLAR